MQQMCPLVISISRQRGCGGAYLGQEIARELGLLYLDRALIADIAKKLELPEDVIEANDERLASPWESIIASLSCSNPWMYNPPPINPASEQVRQLESEAILKIAYEQPVVIVGRGASFLLRDHPRHVSVFLYACKQFRTERIQNIYGISRQDAIKLIDKADAARCHYNKAISGISMVDATQYNLTIDTGTLGLDNAVSLVLQYVRMRFDGQIKSPCA